jgi:uncharacterized membrane protein (DUF485 family)
MKRKTIGAMHSKTMWFSFALVILGVVYDNFSYVENLIDPRLYGIVLISIGIVVAILRFVTTLPLEEK